MDLRLPEPAPELPDGLTLHRGLVDLDQQKHLWAALSAGLAAAPPVHPRVKGGGKTLAAMTNFGQAGWWSDVRGYRYERANPTTGKPWPDMPSAFVAVVRAAVADSPWPSFVPDACLINHYAAGTRMGLHQDRDERDFGQPIVTVSLGDSADWLIGGAKRGDKPTAFRVNSGDVLLMGGPARLLFHGVRKIHPGTSPLAGIAGRYSLTFRKAF